MRQDRPQTSVWDNEGFKTERQNIMMTFSDAKECTFQPSVCTRMPNKLKQHMKDTHTWATGIVDRKTTMKDFILKFGDNFSRFPRIYRYGVYKRAVVWAKNGDYRRAYKAIAENFNIKELKQEFSGKLHDDTPHPIFAPDKLDLDEEKTNKIASEDFKDEGNKNFLQEIYQFIRKLENYETDLLKT